LTNCDISVKTKSDSNTQERFGRHRHRPNIVFIGWFRNQ